MTYCLDFDYATLILCLLLIYLYFVRPRFRDFVDIAFMGMVVALLAVTALDIVTALILENPGMISDVLNYQINIVFLIVTSILPFPCFIYVLILTTGKLPSFRTCLPFIVITGIIVLLVVMTPFTHWIIQINQGTYTHGPYFDSFYLLPVIYLLFFANLLAKKRVNLTPPQGFAVGFFMLNSVVATAVQTMYPSILFMGLAVGIFAMSMYLTAQNPDCYLEDLTGCYNAAAFKRVMQREFSAKGSGFIVVGSVKDFDYINQTYGRSTGDAVVGHVGAFLKKAFGQQDVFRLFGCSYIIKVDDEDGIARIVRIAKEQEHRVITINGIDLSLISHFLVIPYPEVITEADDIIEVVTYYLSRPVVYGSDHMMRVGDAYLDARLHKDAVNQAIKLAISQRSFEPFFQPIYNVRTRRLDSAEVLIRLNDPQLGFISPDEFITLAEETGSVTAIDGILFEKILAFISENHIERYGIEYLECNLSPVECIQSGFAEHLLERMDHYGVSHQMIDFEITETAPSDCDEALGHMMDTLIAEHSSFALDDYGTGFAASSYLIKYRFKLVKIDKVLLWHALGNETGYKLLDHTVILLHDLGYEVVVEGVETKEQFDLLVSLGVEHLQGYYIAKPMNQDAFLKTIKEDKVCDNILSDGATGC